MDTQGFQKLGHKALLLFIAKRIGIAIGFLILEVILIVLRSALAATPAAVSQSASLASFFAFALMGVLIFFTLALIFGIIGAYIKYITFKYRLGENGLEIQKGIFGKEEISVPFRQIQNVDIDQTFSYRMMGVCNLNVLTAGHEDKDASSQDQSEIMLPAIPLAEAKRVQDYLLQRANVQEVVPEAPLATPAPLQK